MFELQYFEWKSLIYSKSQSSSLSYKQGFESSQKSSIVEKKMPSQAKSRVEPESSQNPLRFKVQRFSEI